MGTIKAVIFDVDGTLVDTNYHHVESWARALSEVGSPVPRAIIHQQIGKGSDQFLPEFIQDDQIAERAKNLHSTYFKQIRPTAYPLPGARDLLTSLKDRDLPAYFATSADPDELEFLIECLGAADLIAGTVSKGDVESSKPDPDIFASALKKAAVPADQAIVVGDTIWDIEAARRAGLRTVAVLTGGAFSRAELTEAGAIAVYDDCAALLNAGFPDGLA